MAFRILIFFLLAFISNVNGQQYPYTIQADAGLLLGDGVRPVPGIQVFNGIRLKKNKMEAGLTVGTDIYSQFTIIPVYASVKWTPLAQKDLMPYLGLNMGYGLAWLNKGSAEKEFQGGIVFNPTLGIRIKTNTKARLNFGLGFKQQRAGIISRRFDDLGRTVSEISEEYKFDRIALSFGIGF